MKLSNARHDEDEFLNLDTEKDSGDEYLIRYLAAVVPDNEMCPMRTLATGWRLQKMAICKRWWKP